MELQRSALMLKRLGEREPLDEGASGEPQFRQFAIDKMDHARRGFPRGVHDSDLQFGGFDARVLLEVPIVVDAAEGRYETRETETETADQADPDAPISSSRDDAGEAADAAGEPDSAAQATATDDYAQQSAGSERETTTTTAAPKRTNPEPSKVVQLTDATFSEQVFGDKASHKLVLFYAPWCGHCQALMPTWRQLSRVVPSNVKVMQIDATANQKLAEKLAVNGYPTIFLARRSATSVADLVRHEKGRSLGELLDAIKELMQIPRVLVQLRTDADFKKYCAHNMCIIAILPDVREHNDKGAQRKRYLEVLKKSMDFYGSGLVQFAWTVGGYHTAFEEQMRVGDLGYPRVVCVDVLDKKYNRLVGRFEPETLVKFALQCSTLPETLRVMHGERAPLESTAGADGENDEL